MRNDQRLIPAALVLLLLPWALFGADVYKWTDELGATHYSDAPPPGSSKRLEGLPVPTTQPPREDAEHWRRLDQAFTQRHQGRMQDLELAAVGRGEGVPVPGNTGALPGLQRDVLRIIVLLDQGQDRTCSSHRVTETRILSQEAPGAATEMWMLDRCGKLVSYRVAFMPAPQGGTNFSVQRER